MAENLPVRLGKPRSPVTFFIVLGIGGCGRQTWYDFLPLSSMIRGVV
ncbi:hypothetical protein DFR67_1041, partial [Williamsia limnetica]